jgi:hypothetical protein
MRSHLQFLEQRLSTLSHLPTRFEYYSAIHLSKLHNICFYVYQDIPDSHKRNAGFPVFDKGVDLIDETFRHIVQVKYYGPKRKIGYGHLATFLGTPILVGRRYLNLNSGSDQSFQTSYRYSANCSAWGSNGCSAMSLYILEDTIIIF